MANDVRRLTRISELIHSNMTLRSVVEEIALAISQDIAACDCVTICLPNPGLDSYQIYVQKPEELKNSALEQHELTLDKSAVVRHMVETRQSVYVRDTATDPMLNPRLVQAFGVKSVIGFPIFGGEHFYGLLFLSNFTSELSLCDSQIAQMEAYISICAVAFYNARLLNTREDIITEQRLLLSAVRQLTLSATMDDVVEVTLRMVARALGNDNVRILMWDESGNLFRLKQHSYISTRDEVAGRFWKRSDVFYSDSVLLGEVVRTKQPLRLPDTSLAKDTMREEAQRFGLRSLYVLPLLANGELVGIVAVTDKDSPRDYPGNRLELARSITEAASTSLANVMQVDRLSRIVRDRTAELNEKNEMLQTAVSNLTQQDEEKDRFIASVAHECKTPMTAIKGSLDLLQMGVMGEMTGEQKELIDMAVEASDRLLKRVNDILDFARYQNRGFPIHKRDEDYSRLVRDVVDVMTSVFSKKGISLEVSTQENITLSLDSERIEQVLLNLLENASKFTQTGGSVFVSFARAGHEIVTSVRDTGVGIPDDSLDKIFAPFYQVNLTPRSNGGGSGLGLSIAKQIVELHHGRMWVESEGRGSTFYFSLPLQTNAEMELSNP